MNPITYGLDAEDRITAVNESWDQFAASNGGRACLAPNIVGRPLWEFVRDPALSALYERIFSAVRSTGRTMAFPYRCDSPDTRRFLRMTIAPGQDGAISVTSEVERTEPIRTPVAVSGAARGATFLKRCSICLDVGLGTNVWRSIEDALESGELAREERPLRAIYSVCPSCRGSLGERAAAL